MYFHEVQSGETLYQISQMYNVPLEKIIQDNGITNPSQIVVGQSLIVLPEDFTYEVEPGETLYSISEKINVPLETLIAFNPEITNPDIIYPGQKINVVFDNINKVPMEINGYVYPNVDLNVLRKMLPWMTYVSIFSYQVKEDGTLSMIQDEEIIRTAYQYKVAPLMVITNIDQPGMFSSELMKTIFSSPALEDKLINNIVEIAIRKGYYGVDFDLEYLYPENREDYNRFLEKARQSLAAQGLKISSAIAPKLNADQIGLLYEAHDYAAHGRILDRVIIMTYEWGYLWSEAMPVAPIDRVEQVIQYAVTEIPNKKILMGFPNYGYDFRVPSLEDVPARLITNLEAPDIAYRENAAIEFNEVAQSPYFNYYENGQLREVHFEDPRSVASKIELAIDYNLAGLSYWTLMSYFPQNWVLVNYYLDVIKVIK